MGIRLFLASIIILILGRISPLAAMLLAGIVMSFPQFSFSRINRKILMACGVITIGSDPDCDVIPNGGTRARVGVINYDDMDEPPTLDADGRITALNLVAGKTGFAFVGFRNDVKKSDEVINPGVGLNKFKHNLGFVIYERTQEQKNNIEELAKGRFVVIAENKGKDADAFEVVGIAVGLEIVVGPIRNAHENGGFFVLSFSTPEGEFENKLPQSLGTSYANALTLFDTYIPAASS